MKLIEKIKKLKKETKRIFEKIFDYQVYDLKEINILLNDKFKDFKNQKILVIQDKVFNKETIYNPTRKKRPQPQKKVSLKEKCSFCQPKKETPEDYFGRLENEAAISALNISQMANFHSLIIFKKHTFQQLKEKDFVLALELAKEWFSKINLETKILIWNFGYRSGASIFHPHFQLLAYKKIPLKIKIFNEKLKKYPSYFDDYLKIALELKIGKIYNQDFKTWFNLAPAKEREINFLTNLEKIENRKILWQIIKKYQAENFNLFYLWNKFGYLLDRGLSSKKNSDFGSLEIFLSPVVSFDPPIEAQKLF